MGSPEIPSVYFEPGFLPRTLVIPPPRRRYWLHALLFLLTIFTTLVVGARLAYRFHFVLPAFTADDRFFPLLWILRDPALLRHGIPYSATLLAILFAHEMGHFLAAVRYRVYATLPFFIPFPSFIGTFGAFIQIKSAFPDRRSLFDIGIAGPIAGFLVAVPLAFAGLALSVPVGINHHAAAEVGYPLLYQWGYALLDALHVTPPHAPDFALMLHPVAIAAWVGMLATAMNLIPGGQLDGGHLIFALFGPRWHRAISHGAMALLFLAGYFYWLGWMVWAIALRLTLRHPLLPAYPAPPRSRYWMAGIAVLLFALTFIPAPFPGGGLRDVLRDFFHR